MPATVIIAYPRGAELDVGYYTSKHIPLVLPGLQKAGLRSWRVARTVAKPGAAEPPEHEALVLLEFDSLDAVAALSAPGSEEDRKAAADDLKNFSKLPPVSWVVEEVAASAAA